MTHEATFTKARWFGMNHQRVEGVGLYCSCGWVWGMGNQLSAERAYDDHVLSEAGIEAIHA